MKKLWQLEQDDIQRLVGERLGLEGPVDFRWTVTPGDRPGDQQTITLTVASVNLKQGEEQQRETNVDREANEWLAGLTGEGEQE